MDKANFFACDLSKTNNICTLVSLVEQTYGRLDGLFNNAGIFLRRVCQISQMSYGTKYTTQMLALL